MDHARAARLLGGDAGWPAVDGDPVFDEPWQARAFAMAFEVIDRTGLPWKAFRERLVAAIAEDPGRPYYESWLVALERLALGAGAVDQAAVDHARNDAASYRYDEEVLGDVEAFPFRADAEALDDVLAELRCMAPARCQHAELYRLWVDGAPTAWGVRMFDGDDHQQLDVRLPSPFLDDDDRPLDHPDWSRLACWDDLRRRLLGLGPDPADRFGRRSGHA